MKTTLLIVLAVAGSVLSQDENPCSAANNVNGFQFVNDWSGCQHYFWCNGEEAVPTLPCDENFGFDEANQLCTTTAFEEANADGGSCVLTCPIEGTLAVGDVTDADCRRWAFCVDGTRGPLQTACSSTLRFNRVPPGSCDFSANVNCFPAGESETVIPDGVCLDAVTGEQVSDGNVEDPTTCDAYYICIVDHATERRVCRDGLHFNPATRNCDLPANRVPLCTIPAKATNNAYPRDKLPTVPHERTKSFKRKLFSRLGF